MKKLKIIGLGLIVISSIWSCSRQNYSKAEKNRLRNKMLSESLQAPGKKEDLQKLAEVLSENVGLENNHFIFRLSKKEFKKTGLPAAYFDKIQREMKSNNDFIDANHLNADKLLTDGKLFPTKK